MSQDGPPANPPADIGQAFDRIEQLLEFPADFPLKVMGQRVDGFAQAISALVTEHIPAFDPAGIELRTSSRGTYLSLTLPLRVDSRAQLEGLYRALAGHPWVRIVL
jgi:putative lipoic acid-binding regulatory protein